MSSVLKHIEANPQETQRLIGLKYPKLQILLQNAEQLHHEKEALLESRKIRIISGGGGRKPKLSIPRTNNFNLGVSQTHDDIPTSWYPVRSE